MIMTMLGKPRGYGHQLRSIKTTITLVMYIYILIYNNILCIYIYNDIKYHIHTHLPNQSWKFEAAWFVTFGNTRLRQKYLGHLEEYGENSHHRTK